MKPMSKSLKIASLIVTALTIVVGFNNCGGVNFSNKALTSESLSSEGFIQSIYTAPVLSAPTDILFVIDNSHSMTAELSNLGQRFPALAQKLGNKDWQACLVTTDWENERGALRPWNDSSYVLTPQTAHFETVFQNTLNQITQDNAVAPSYYEHGISSAHDAFDHAFTSMAHGCFRPNAAKVVVIVSDEDELGDGWTQPHSETPLPQDLPENLVLKAKEMFGNDVSLSVHAVAVTPGDLSCLNQQRMETGTYDISYGYEAVRYQELVNMTHGIFVNICQPDYSESLSEIGDSLSKPVSDIPLPCNAFVKSVNGHIFSVKNNVLHLDPALAPGESVEFSYQCIN